MRVTIEHHQETTGLGSKTSQFVDCVVLFSEEEKAIIKVRGLNDHVIVVDPPSPPPSYREYMTAGVLQGFAPFFVLVGFLLIFSGIFAGGGYAIVGALLVVLTPIGWAIGFLMDRYMNVRFTHPKQHISVRAMLAGPFRVYSPDPAYSDLVVDQIRERLTFLKQMIVGSADLRERQSYEL